MPEWKNIFYFKLTFKLKTQIWVKTLSLKINLGNKKITLNLTEID